MAFDKAKVLKAAEKFLSQGKINAAIKEYRQIVDNDVDDFTTLNMLGDLYVRSNKKEEAIAWLQRGYEERDFRMTMISVVWEFDNIRSDPRFVELVRKIGLPQ